MALHYRVLLAALLLCPVVYAAPPTVSTGYATGVATESALLRGTINPNGNNTTASFQYGLTASYGTTVDSHGIDNGSDDEDYTYFLNGLTSGTTYHYRAAAAYGGGTAFGADSYFVTQVPGVGTALRFNGTNQSAIVPLFGFNAPTSEITVELWQKANTAKTQVTLAISPDDVSNRITLEVPWSDGNVYWFFGDVSNNGRLVYTPSDSIPGAWNHWAFVSSATGNFMKIYRNGVEVATKTGHGVFTRSGRDLAIGGIAGQFFGGDVDEVRIWNVARSASAIQTNMLRRLNGNENGLMAYWRCDEGAGPTAHSPVSAGTDAALSNGPLWIPGVVDIGIPLATLPVVTNLTTTSATFTANVDPNGLATTAHFVYDSDTPDILTPDVNLGVGTQDVQLSANVTGLTPDSEYECFVHAVNARSPMDTDATVFTTPPLPPTITSVTPSLAAAGATVDIHGTHLHQVTSMTFNGYAATYTEDPSDTVLHVVVPTVQVGSQTGTWTVVTNGGTAQSSATFSVILPPDVTTGDASDVLGTSANLHATVNTYGAPATVHFEWAEASDPPGPPSGVWTSTPTISVPAATGPQLVSQEYGGFFSGDNMLVRAVTQSSGGLTTGSPTYLSTPTTPSGTCLYFAAPETAVVPHAPSQNPYPFTVSMLIKPTTGDGGFVDKYVASSTGPPAGWHVGETQFNIRAWYAGPNGSVGLPGADGLGMNGGTASGPTWKSVVFTVDGNGGKLYVDNVLMDQAPWVGTPGPPTTTAPIRFGGSMYPAPNDFYQGRLDEVRLYNVALSPADIGRYAYTPLTGTEAGLVGYWNLDDGAGPVASDSSGYGNAAMITATPGQPLWTRSDSMLGPPFNLIASPATPIASDSAITGGTANPRWAATNAFLEWGTTTAYGQVTPPANIGASYGDVPFSAYIGPLQNKTRYHYRITAANPFGVSHGPDISFVWGGPYTISNAVRALRISAGLLQYSAQDTVLDVDKSGTPGHIDAFDAVRLMRIVAGVDAGP